MKATAPESGFVLHTRPYRDSSMLVEFFARRYGRVSLVARGARGRKQQDGSTAALLQLFAPVACSWSGRSELKTLVHCESEGVALRLRGTRMYSGLYLNELLSRLLHHDDPHEVLFDAYRATLLALAGDAGEETVLRRFEFMLLESLGYGFELGVDGMSGDPISAEGWYHYDHDYGLVRATAGQGGQRPRFRGADLQQIERGDFSGASRSCAKQLLRQVLSSHLGDKPLKSRELFRQLP